LKTSACAITVHAGRGLHRGVTTIGTRSSGRRECFNYFRQSGVGKTTPLNSLLRLLQAEQVGVMIGLEVSSARARISRYETGEHDPSEATAQKIAGVFGVPLAYFYCTDEQLGDIIRCYDLMDDAGRARLAEVATTLVKSSNR
jgi:transcriptional regulator with XRE-family HTH domain